jgi:uroporphyrinogen decarboxylase
MVSSKTLLVAVGAAAVCGASAFSAPGSATIGRLNGNTGARLAPRSVRRAAPISMNAEHDILLRAAKGEATDRSPVWLMRQAGRYMKDFRAFSDKYPFRHRSETPEIAIELSLQPFRAFGTDGIIMFSDILTPLPSMGIEFDVIKGSGPKIFDPIRSMDQVKKLTPIDDPDKSVPFLREIIGSLRKEAEGKTTLLGFIGSPFTLAAYSVEGKVCDIGIYIRTHR